MKFADGKFAPALAAHEKVNAVALIFANSVLAGAEYLRMIAVWFNSELIALI